MRRRVQWQMWFVVTVTALLLAGQADADPTIEYVADPGPAQNPTAFDSRPGTSGNQHWTLFSVDPNPQVAAGPVSIGGVPAWQIDTAGTPGVREVQYLTLLSPAERALARTSAWRISVIVRLPDQANLPLGGIWVDLLVGDGPGNLGTDFQMLFGTDASGDPVVVLPTVANTTVGQMFTIVGGADAFHRYDLVFDPAGVTADLFVDGALALAAYGGSGGQPLARFLFGDNSVGLGDTVAQFNLVRWESIAPVPEPSPFALVAVCCSLAWATRRKRLRDLADRRDVM